MQTALFSYKEKNTDMLNLFHLKVFIRAKKRQRNYFVAILKILPIGAKFFTLSWIVMT